MYDNMVIQYGPHNINHPIFPSFPEVSLAQKTHCKNPDPTDLLGISGTSGMPCLRKEKQQGQQHTCTKHIQK